MKRRAFFISDSTGITAETLGQSLLAHFDHIEFNRQTLSFIDTEQKAIEAVEKINQAAQEDGAQPIIFDTVVKPDIRKIIANSNGFIIDIISGFLGSLEQALDTQCNRNVGRPNISLVDQGYKDRIDAMHYALSNDDGAKVDRYVDADIILIGVSRCGKTPTSLYLALQTGVYTANYPLTEDDLDNRSLPKPLKEFKDKLFGLTIDPLRLSTIRQERRPNSHYASLTHCEDEVRQAQSLFNRFTIPYIDTTDCSIEEISTRIVVESGLREKNG